jgi:hypothetical protein
VTGALDSAIEAALQDGAVRALRRRAEIQAKRAADGETPADERFPDVVIRSGESAIASSLSAALSAVADELEREATQ